MAMRDRRSVTLVAASVIAVTAICWLWIVPMALDMYGAMTGPSAWMMTSEWDARHTVLLWSMWAVMMAAMMLPSAMPVLLLYGMVVRRRNDAPKAALHVYAMMSGYLLVWALFSVGATVVQRILSQRLLLNPMMELASPSAAAVVLLIAGVYQLTPFKWTCLRTCRSPLSFVTRAWHAGLSGAVRMGVEHGIFCLGCCWALMLLLFAGGVMNLWVIAALTLVVMIEKLAPFGRQISRATGIVLIAVALGLFTR
jgi:predicted metal-binding membrane protein